MMKKKHLYAAVILVVFLAVGAQPAAIQVPSQTHIGGTQIATYTTGGTYTLIKDVAETLFIEQSDLTLDGNGHTITGPGSTGAGVDINGRNGITVKNLTITGFSIGININNSNPGPVAPEINTVENNTISGCTTYGIELSHAYGTILRGNNISNNHIGIQLASSGKILLGNINDFSNTITGNTLEYNNGGIYLSDSHYNTLTGNTVTGHTSSVNGIYLLSSNHNQINNNNFITNTTQAKVISSSSNNFDGNYWSDRIGEVPYLFEGGQDGSPWDVPNGWLIPVNQSPIADAGPYQTVNQDSPAGASVTFDGSGSTDDGQIQPLTYTWSWAGGGSVTGVNPTVTLPLGTTAVTLTVFDGVLDDTDTVDITVQSVAPPEDAPEDVVEGIIDYIIEDMYVPKEAEKEVGKAVKELNKAIKEFNKGKIDKAIKKITKAVKELEKAQKKGADTQGVIDELNDLVEEL